MSFLMLHRKEVKMLKKTKRIILFSVFVGAFCFSNSTFAAEGGLGRAALRFLEEDVGNRVEAMANRTAEYLERRQEERRREEEKKVAEISALEEYIRGREEAVQAVSQTDFDKLTRMRDELGRQQGKITKDLERESFDVATNLGMAAGDVIRAQGEKATRIGVAEATLRE
jgi:hypothetical protein